MADDSFIGVFTFEYMLNILSAAQTRHVDSETIRVQGIESIELMERASALCAVRVADILTADSKVALVAGVGNNGGDAAAIARMLKRQGFKAKLFLLDITTSISPDLEINIQRARDAGVKVKHLNRESKLPDFGQYDVIVDGIFGSGLSRPIDSGWLADTVRAINVSKARVVSIDTPSGFFADEPTPEGSAVVKADLTLTFNNPFLSFLLPQAVNPIGKWEVLDIGLDQKTIEELDCSHRLLTRISNYYPAFKRSTFQHKGDNGRLLMLCGSKGKMGAALMAVSAAMRSGAGLTTAMVPGIGLDIMQQYNPEAMCIVSSEEDCLAGLPMLDKYTAIACGAGIGKSEVTRQLLFDVLSSFSDPVVLDADALNLIAESDQGCELIPKGSVITPHVGEFDRLFGKSETSFERLEKLKENAQKYGLHIVLKGAHTMIADTEGRVFFNTTGNPGMAKGGSGDVLTGIIGGLLAQSNDPFVAAVCGVYVHGLAADLGVSDISELALMPTDIIDNLGAAFKQAFESTL